jgi:quercetin dioxygenase-like cupin family protein
MDQAPEIEAQVRRDVDSRAEAQTFGSVEWASREGSPAGAETTIGLAVFDAGKSNVEHVHPNCEEVVYVLDGEVEHTLGDQSTVLRAGDLIVVPRNVPHRLINRSATAARTYIVFSSPDRQFVPTDR